MASLEEYRKQKEELLESGKTLQMELVKSRQKVRSVEAIRAEKAKQLADKEKQLTSVEVWKVIMMHFEFFKFL